MRPGRRLSRWLVLVTVVLATVTMHTGVGGACADHTGAGAPMVMAAPGAHARTSTSPVAPIHDDHAGTSMCQSPLPPTHLSQLGAVPAAVLVTGLEVPTLRDRLGHAASTWWPPPPVRSALGIWRI